VQKDLQSLGFTCKEAKAVAAIDRQELQELSLSAAHCIHEDEG